MSLRKTVLIRIPKHSPPINELCQNTDYGFAPDIRSRRLGFLFAFILLSFMCVGCGADNATSLSDRIGEGASRLSSRDAGSSLTVSFDPINGAASPYTVIFFPDRDVPEADLVAAGVDTAIARRIYTDLAYLGSMAGKLVVEQEGERLKFTSSWKRQADVEPPNDLVVSRRKTGPAAIELRREDGAIRVVAIR